MNDVMALNDALEEVEEVSIYLVQVRMPHRRWIERPEGLRGLYERLHRAQADLEYHNARRQS